MGRYETIEVAESDGVTTLTLNRPEARNSMTRLMAREMLDAVQRISVDLRVRIVVLTGAESQAFCPGADVKAHAAGGANPELESDPLLDRVVYRIPVLLHQMPQVTIAAINGSAAGAGLSWASACDFRWAAESAKFSTAFLDRGVAGDMCLHWTLPRIVGPAAARQLMFFPDKFDTSRAKELGLVSEVFADDAFRAEVATRVGRLRAAPPLALRALKENLIDAERSDLSTFSDLESHRHFILLESEDSREGFAAFVAGRPPQFRGR